MSEDVRWDIAWKDINALQAHAADIAENQTNMMLTISHLVKNQVELIKRVTVLEGSDGGEQTEPKQGEGT